jgi:hypothetical protein
LLAHPRVRGSQDHNVFVESIRVQLRIAVAERANVGVEEAERKIRAVLMEVCGHLSAYEQSPFRLRILGLTRWHRGYIGLFHDECNLVVEAWCSLIDLLQFDGRIKEAEEEDEKLGAWAKNFSSFLTK